jgi:small-conductance mechanosensitive channel
VFDFVLDDPIPLFPSLTWGELLYIVLVVLLAAVVAKAVTLYLRKTLTDKIKLSQLDILLKGVNYVILIITALIIVPFFNISLSGLLVAGGFASIVIGIASQSVLGNLISGVFLILERPISIGDNINIGNVSGNVTDINIFSTIVKTYDGVYVRIPNENVFTSEITNYVAHEARRFEYVIGIPYDDDANEAIRIIREVVWSHPFALKDPSPSIYVDELADSSVNIKVRIWAPATEWWDVRTDLLWKIKVELSKNGIEMPFPQQVVWFQNELQGRVALRSGEGRAQAGPEKDT